MFGLLYIWFFPRNFKGPVRVEDERLIDTRTRLGMAPFKGLTRLKTCLTLPINYGSVPQFCSLTRVLNIRCCTQLLLLAWGGETEFADLRAVYHTLDIRMCFYGSASQGGNITRCTRASCSADHASTYEQKKRISTYKYGRSSRHSSGLRSERFSLSAFTHARSSV